MIILKILAFIFGLGIIILVHELGHFIFAKRAKILCYEFSIGMGPKLWSKKKGETTYSIRAIPIGGFVSMAGEEGTGVSLKEDCIIGVNIENGLVIEIILDENVDAMYRGTLISHDLYAKDSEELFIEFDCNGEIKRLRVKEDAKFILENNNEIQIAPYGRCFESKTIWQRFITMFAGPMMNFILAIVIYLIYSTAVGVPNYDSTVIGTASGNATRATVVSVDGVDVTPYEISLEGAEIKEIEGKKINSWNDIGVSKTEGNIEIPLIVVKDGKELSVTVNPIIMIANLGVWGDTSKTSNEGVLVYMYTVNAQEAFGLSNDDIENDKSITITNIDGIDITSWKDLIVFCDSKNGDEVKVKYIIDGNTKETTYKLYDDKTLEGLNMAKINTTIGVSPTMKFSLIKSTGNAFIYFKDDALTIFSTLKLLFTSKDVGVGNLSGPIGIFSLVGSSVESGILSFLAIIALLCVNVGVINLLPIPALDGGRICFLLYELITKKKVNKKVEDTLNTVMFILIMVLFVYIAFNDVLRLV